MRAEPRTRHRCAGAPRGKPGRSVWVLLAAVLALPGLARAQTNPVFLNDSTLAADVLAGLPGLLASDNTGEAVRLLQRLLDQEADRLVATAGDPDLLESVRARVHRVLLGDPKLLERYRTVETETAARLLAEGDAAGVERARLLTAPGFDAALRVAADHLSAARFESARLTLEQLDSHPDRTDTARSAQAASLWRRIEAYLDRPEVALAAERWAGAAGLAHPAPEPVPWPDSLRVSVASPLVSAPGFDLDELVDTPLCSVELREGEVVLVEDEPLSRRARPIVEFPYLFPLVSGDTVFATDGLWIGAWDRFTLTPRWRTKPRGADNERETLEELYAAAAYRQNRSRDIEEATTLALHGRLLLGATGLVADGGREGDPRLHALDAVTGRILWSTYIDEIDPQLDESSTRGPAVFEGDLAVVAVRKISQSRRFASAFLVGIDLADGSARWVRLAGSAGWLSYGGRGQWTDWPTVHRGVVYRVDELGVICAVEAGSGRYRWVLRLPGVESRLPSPRLPWAASQVVIDGDTLLALAPDRRELLRIDQATGRILARRDTQPLGLPGYIFPHGDRLIGVAPARITTLPIAQAESAPAMVSALVPDPGILGRVVAAGDSLLLPLASGLGVVDLATLEAERGVTLSAPGNLIPLGQQLLTADNQRLHSYLVWNDAAAVLQARLDADPADAAIAITYAELAQRSGHAEAMLAPIDAALGAMAADPLVPTVAPSQDRLFRLLLGALRGALQPDAGPLPPTELLDGMAERLGMVAASPDQRAAHRLMSSQLDEQLGRFGDAVAECQAILADPLLAGATWERDASSVRAEIDALSRLDRLLARGGGAVYAPFEAAADAALAQLRAEQATADRFESLARTHPRASAALEAWLAAADLHAARGDALAHDRALDRGLRCALATRDAGLTPDPAIVGELLGHRLTALLEANRLDTAADLLGVSQTDWPGVGLTNAGTPLERDALSAALQARAEARNQRPRLGDLPLGRASEVDGWVLMRALDRRGAQASRPGVMLLSVGRVGLWRFDGDSLTPAWTISTRAKPALLRFDPDRVLLLEPDEQGGTLLALDPADGRELWRTARLGEALARAAGPAAVAGQERFDTPLDGEVAAGDLLLAIDETTIALVSRSGRVAGIDLATGRVAWARRSECQQVNDAAAGDGVLALGGTAAAETGDAAGEPIVCVLDLASGEEISRYTPALGPATGKVRWLHLAPGSRRVIVGLSRGIVGLALPEATPDWTLADLAVEQSTGAWTTPRRVFVQTSMRELALLDSETGELLDGRLETAGCLALDEPIDGVAADQRLVLLGPAGCAMLDAATGELLAADAIDPIAGMVQPALGQERLALMEREPVPGQQGLYRLHILDAATGRALSTTTLALTDRPRRVALLDGAVLITAGDSTVVLPTE